MIICIKIIVITISKYKFPTTEWKFCKKYVALLFYAHVNFIVICCQGAFLVCGKKGEGGVISTSSATSFF